jgi:DNA polymerase III epsilon subunit-like protein
MQILHTYLVFDFETTGLDPDRDRIIQVGLCIVTDRQVTDRLGWLVNQDVEVPLEARRVHGITTADIRAHGLPPRESLARLFDALAAAPVCMGHNIHQFDALFLLAESQRLGLTPPVYSDFVDTAALFKGWKLGLPRGPDEDYATYTRRVLGIRTPGLKYSVPACLQALGVKVDPSHLHDASNDAYATHLIFEALQKVLPAGGESVQSRVRTPPESAS